MVKLRSFKAYRPRKDLAHKVAALPYDVMSTEEARAMVKDNMYSFLHVDKAEIDLEKDVNIYDKRVYEKARDNLNGFIKNAILIQDSKPAIYVYRLIMEGRVQTGIVACASIDDYANNIIKKHEKTREDKEIDRIKHVNICNAHTGPIFLTYRENEDIDSIVAVATKEEPVYDFIAEDGIEHIVWVINNKEMINKLISSFDNIPNVYIADGHHRAFSAVNVGLMRREQAKGRIGEENYDYFLSVLFPSSHLKIMDYNRLVKDTNNLTVKELLKKISEKFTVESYEGSFKPYERHTFGMYVEGKWYKLKVKDGTFNSENHLESLDVSILQDNLLSPILGITNPRKDDRIEFIGGIRGVRELANKADEYNGVSFAMYPTTINELMDISDLNETMPPKSTWFEPKPRSGLFIHEL